MKRIAYYLLLLSLLSPALCRADRSPVTHQFGTMSNPSEIAFSNSNKVAKTALLSYTCTGTDAAEFDMDLINAIGGKALSINLPDKNDFVTTTAVDDLAGLEIRYYRNASDSLNLKLQLSRDSVHWTGAITPTSRTHGVGKNTKIIADFVPGRYYVRLTNTKSGDISIYKIVYSFGSCNCVMYIPE